MSKNLYLQDVTGRIQSAVGSEEALSDEQVVLSGRGLSAASAVMWGMRKRLLGGGGQGPGAEGDSMVLWEL